MPVRLTWHFNTKDYNIGFMVQTLRSSNGVEDNSVAHIPLALHSSHEHTICGQQLIERDDLMPSMSGGADGACHNSADSSSDSDAVIVLVSFDNSHSVLRDKELSYCVSCISVGANDAAEQLSVSFNKPCTFGLCALYLRP